MSRWVFAVSLIALSGCVEFMDLEDPVEEDGEGRPQGHDNEPDGVGTGSGSGGGGGGSGGSGMSTACAGEVADGRCYTLYSESRTWSDARTQCASRGERLAKVSSMAVHQAVMAQLSVGATVYLGANADQPGSFKWIDGTPLAGFVMWQPFEPSTNAGENCLAALDAGLSIGWTNETCVDPRPYVCERQL
jgi:Lectin C-type domain